MFNKRLKEEIKELKLLLIKSKTHIHGQIYRNHILSKTINELRDDLKVQDAINYEFIETIKQMERDHQKELKVQRQELIKGFSKQK